MERYRCNYTGCIDWLTLINDILLQIHYVDVILFIINYQSAY